MSANDILEQLFIKHGFNDFRWVEPREIVVAQWVRMKCLFGCKEFGRNPCCPPFSPSVDEGRGFFREYSRCAVFHFSRKFNKPDERYAWTKKINSRLLVLEKDIFCLDFPKAFLFFLDSCNLCASCSGRPETCKRPKEARPTPESFGMDVFSTVRKIGYPINVLKHTAEEMNRYAFMMID